MKVETTVIIGRFSVFAEKRLSVWCHAFAKQIVDRFPPTDLGGLPPRFRLIEGGRAEDGSKRAGGEP